VKRRIILICIAVVLAAGSVFAQTAAPTASRKAGTKQVQKQGCRANKKLGVKALLQKLDLTADQKIKIRAICKEAAARIKAVKADKSLTPAQAKVNIKGVRKAEWAQVKQVLTPAQLQKLRALMKNRRK